MLFLLLLMLMLMLMLTRKIAADDGAFVVLVIAGIVAHHCCHHLHLQGPYDTPVGFQSLSSRLDELEAPKPQANRMFFLSIPPNVFLPATGNAADYARSKYVSCA